MYHSDKIINDARLNDIHQAFEPKSRPLGAPAGGSLRSAVATLATFAGACFVAFGTGLLG